MSSFLSATANYDDFINMPSGEINNHLQKNNEVILKKAFTFFQNDSKILLINGFAGVGKIQISEHTLSYLDKTSITLKYVCCRSTRLDDIHLNFMNILSKKIPAKNKAELDAIESISDKIEYILSTSELKFVPVLYNFDSIKEENKQDILNYIFSITEKERVKTIICAKTFDTDLIPEKLKYIKIMPKALSKELFEVYLKEFGIKITPAMVDQLYRLSRGYFFSACVSAKIMINQELTINDFIVQYTNSGEKFDTFLAKAYYKLIVGTTKSAFNLFLTLNHGLNLKVLQQIGSYPENILKMLATNYYIYKRGELYYPTEFLEIQLKDFVAEEISKKRLATYYEKQLSLPPEERDFIISRASLHDEIALCKGIEPETDDKISNDAEKSVKQEEGDDELSKEHIDFSNLSTNELYTKAEELFKKFEYNHVIEILTIILDRKNEIKDSELEHKTYYFLAKTFDKIDKWKYALYYYDLLEEYYKSVNDTERLHNILFEKASIFYKSYRIVDSIKLLKNLAAISKNSKIISGSNLLLGNIAITASNKELAKQHYKTAIENVDDTFDKPMQMELFFKYAVLADESGDMAGAIEFYTKCININEETSKYKALAYSNMGDLFYDNEFFDDAKECFQKAYEADKLNQNEYGMYYALAKIIELTDKKDKDTLVKLATEAKEHALKTDDYNALLLSIIKLGDVYYDYPEPEKALAEYASLYNEGVEVIEEPNFSMIKSRMEDIRARIGKDRFEELVPNYV